MPSLRRLGSSEGSRVVTPRPRAAFAPASHGDIEGAGRQDGNGQPRRFCHDWIFEYPGEEGCVGEG